MPSYLSNRTWRVSKPESLRRHTSLPSASGGQIKAGHGAKVLAAKNQLENEDQRLDWTGKILPTVNVEGADDVISAIRHAKKTMFCELPSRAGMNSTQVAEVLNFQKNIPPVASLAHVHAIVSASSKTERQISELLATGELRKLRLVGRGNDVTGIGELLILTSDLKGMLEALSIDRDIVSSFLAVLREHPRVTAIPSSSLAARHVTALTRSGFLVSSTANRQKLESLGGSSLVAMTTVSRAHSGTFAAVGGNAAFENLGGVGLAKRTGSGRHTHSAELALSVPNIGVYARLLSEGRSHFMDLLNKFKYKEAPVYLLRERWDGGVDNEDSVSRAKRARALERVEAKRKELEVTVSRLRKSLRHWQTLELDYEGLREEFIRLDSAASEEQCLQVARDFKAETLDENDLKALIRDAIKQPSRRPQQLAHVLSKRVEYVARNVETARKQLETEQKNLNVILLAEDPDTQDEAGLPFGEIVEELDESGRVISGKVEHAGTRAADLMDVLEKAGVEGLKEKDGMITATKPTSAPQKATPTVAEKENPVSVSSPNDGAEEAAGLPKTSPEPAVQPETADQDVDSDTSSVSPFPTNDADTEEEAHLRREMINYNLDTMNAIMEELQKKLGLSGMKNLGPNPELADDVKREIDRLSATRPTAAEAARNAAIERAGSTVTEAAVVKDQAKPKKSEAKRKRVAFSDTLDIAPDSGTTRPDTKQLPSRPKPSQAEAKPVNDTVIERDSIDRISSEGLAPAPPLPSARPSKAKISHTYLAASGPSRD
ncbi:hypothetical protein DV738_g3974, partial [Chaetothyriales sp. CBS 135597]